MENNLELDLMKLDALRELTNIGAAHAATSLSQLLATRVDLRVPSVQTVPVHLVGSRVAEPETPIVAVYLRVIEDAPGKALFLFDPESAKEIVRILNASSCTQELFQDEMALSALKEVGNILMGSFLTALAEFTGLNLNFTVPTVAVDMAGAILNAVVLDGEYRDDWVFIETRFSGNQVSGTLVFLPESGTLNNLLGALGV